MTGLGECNTGHAGDQAHCVIDHHSRSKFAGSLGARKQRLPRRADHAPTRLEQDHTNIRMIGGAVGTTIFSAIVGSSVGASGVPSESGFVTAFIGGGVLAAAGAFALFAGRVRRVAREPVAITISTLETKAA